MAEHAYGPEKMREMAGLLRNPPVQFTEDWEEDLQLRVLIGAMRNGAEVLDCAADDQDSLLRAVAAAAADGSARSNRLARALAALSPEILERVARLTEGE